MYDRNVQYNNVSKLKENQPFFVSSPKKYIIAILIALQIIAAAYSRYDKIMLSKIDKLYNAIVNADSIAVKGSGTSIIIKDPEQLQKAKELFKYNSVTLSLKKHFKYQKYITKKLYTITFSEGSNKLVEYTIYALSEKGAISPDWRWGKDDDYADTVDGYPYIAKLKNIHVYISIRFNQDDFNMLKELSSKS